MSKQILAIDLVLENCEVVRFNREHIDFINLNNITRSIIGNDSYTHDHYNVEDVAILIKSNANINDNFLTTYNNENKPFQRILKWNDITGIDVIYSGDKSKHMYVVWKSESSNSNDYQKSKLDDDGNLYIVVSKDKGIMDCFEYYF